tara:strand:+ start:2066 stop:2677 length:612 start_codon:yes stop_codon:yes gene_type:complete
MADFKIKSAAGTGNKTLIQGQDQSGSNYAIQIGDAGASTLTNATITAGTFPIVNIVDTWRLTSDTSATSGEQTVTGWSNTHTRGLANYGSASMSHSSGIFTFPSTGFWKIHYFLGVHASDDNDWITCNLEGTTNNSSYVNLAIGYGESHGEHNSASSTVVFDVTSTTNCKVKTLRNSGSTNAKALGNADEWLSYIMFTRLGDT